MLFRLIRASSRLSGLEPVHACLVLRLIERFLLAVFHLNVNHIGGVMVSLLPLGVVDHGFEPQLGQTKYNKNWYLLLLR